MEADRSVGGRRKRKPLADCTNTVTVSRASQSSSSSATPIKPADPCLTSSLKRIIDDLSLKERVGVGDKYNFGTGNASRSQVAGVTNPSSRAPASPATAPSGSRNPRSVLGVGDTEIVEPNYYSVYTRRKTSTKEKFVSEPVKCLLKDSISGSGEKTHQAKVNVSKPSKAPREKRQCRGKLDQYCSGHTLPQDYIERQRAYFAEIDAFELPEEEVTSLDDLE